jgi:hypothetical protein
VPSLYGLRDTRENNMMRSQQLLLLCEFVSLFCDLSEWSLVQCGTESKQWIEISAVWH